MPRDQAYHASITRHFKVVFCLGMGMGLHLQKMDWGTMSPQQACSSTTHAERATVRTWAKLEKGTRGDSLGPNKEGRRMSQTNKRDPLSNKSERGLRTSIQSCLLTSTYTCMPSFQARNIHFKLCSSPKKIFHKDKTRCPRGMALLSIYHLDRVVSQYYPHGPFSYKRLYSRV